jgi:hypothetical protein
VIYSVSRKAALLSASLLVAALPTVQRASSPAMGVEHAPAAGVSASALASSHAVPQLKWGPRKQLEQPQGNPTDVACPSPVFCLAVDSFGNYTIFNGVKWSTPVHKLLSIGNAFAYYISCATVTFCAAVGSTGSLMHSFQLLYRGDLEGLRNRFQWIVLALADSGRPQR